MAKTMSDATVVSAVAVASGAGSTVATSRSIADSYSTAYYIWITNGPTNPQTTVGEVVVDLSPDDTNWIPFATIKGQTAAQGETEIVVEIPLWGRYARITYGGNAGGDDVTYTVKETQVTSI